MSDNTGSVVCGFVEHSLKKLKKVMDRISVSSCKVRDSVCFCCAMLCIGAAYAVMRCLCVCPSRSWIVSKQINISSKFSHIAKRF